MSFLIIGGGIAGLTAAYRLHQEGIDVTVIEAHKLGGRILSQEVEVGSNTYYHDMGAEYFLSTDTKLIKLVQELNLDYDTYLSQRAIYDKRSGNSMILPSSTDSFWEGVKKKFRSIKYLGLNNISSANKLQKMLPDLFEMISYLYDTLEDTTLDSVYQNAAEEFEDITKHDLMSYLTNQGFNDEFVRKMVGPLFHAIYMLDSTELNALFGILGFAAKNATIYHIKNGNIAIIEALAEKLPEDSIIYDKVNAISKTEDGYQISLEGAEEKISVSHVFAAIPHASLQHIVFDGFDVKEEDKIERLKHIPYNDNVYHHLIEGVPRKKILSLFSQGANTVFIANSKNIVEINSIFINDKKGKGVFDVTSSHETEKTEFDDYFVSMKIIKSQHWKNAYPMFTKDYFQNIPTPKISDTFFCGADSFISSMGNSVLMADLIVDYVMNDNKKADAVGRSNSTQLEEATAD